MDKTLEQLEKNCRDMDEIRLSVTVNKPTNVAQMTPYVELISHAMLKLQLLLNNAPIKDHDRH